MKFVASDLRPFSSIGGKCFLALCQMLVDHGARYGHFDVTREMPDRTTLSRAVPNMVVKTKSAVRAKLSSCQHLALTSDGWTNDFSKVSYVMVTAHYFDSNLNLNSSILDTGAVEERKTADVLKKLRRMS